MSLDLHEKLRKLLALAQQGIGGEKENARSRLEAMMAKHGITLAELEGEKQEIQWFRPKPGKYQKRLLFQTLSFVCGNRGYWSNPKKRGQIGIIVTKAEQIEIELRYQAYLTAMEKEMDIFYSAFVATNKIYHPDAPEKEEGKTDQAELKRIALAMLGMSPVKIHRTLTNSSTEN